MESTIFYSWQSDLNPKINRNFIEDALRKALKVIRNDVSIEESPRFDQATKGIPGSPEIFKSILAKIDKCEIFVCDVSIINSRTQARPCPNPNVLIELGYAIQKLSWDRIIMIFNKAFGDPKNDSPFDIPDRRLLCYEMTEKMLDNSEVKSNKRKKLENMLVNALKIYFTKQTEVHSISRLNISEEDFKPFTNKQITQSGVKLYYYDSPEQCEKILNLFPIKFNKSKIGKATSSTHYKNRKPQNILKGNRLGIEWTLNDEKGWFEINWNTPINCNYLLFINRKSPTGHDPWGPASIFINNEKITELEYKFSGSSILLIDLNKIITIEKLHINIEGMTYPGLSGLEIY